LTIIDAVYNKPVQERLWKIKAIFVIFNPQNYSLENCLVTQILTHLCKKKTKKSDINFSSQKLSTSDLKLQKSPMSDSCKDLEKSDPSVALKSAKYIYVLTK
jgi:hypothetical protein